MYDIVFDVSQVESRPGYVVLRITGAGAGRLFLSESGGHRFQHVPKHDKKGRTHTSTITVATMPEEKNVVLDIDPGDLEIMTCRSSGKGGQNVNKRDTAVQVRHVPTGVMVRCETERSQLQNKTNAIELLRQRLQERSVQVLFEQRAQQRRDQVGSGQRGDKRRSYYFQRDSVVDHVLNKEWKLKSFLRGEWD